MSYKKIILQCLQDLIEHYKSKKRKPYIHVEEEYFLLDDEEQKKLIKEFNFEDIKGKIKYYKSKSGRLWERHVTDGGLREMQKNKVTPFPKIIKG
jgi:glutamine synthetase